MLTIVLRILAGIVLLYPIYFQVKGLIKNKFSNGELKLTRLVIFHVTIALFIANLISLYLVWLVETGGNWVSMRPIVSLFNAFSTLLAALSFAFLYWKTH